MKTLWFLISLLGLACAASAQAPPIVYPAGAYTVTTPGPTVVTYSASSVTLSWTVTPPPTPVPPAPTPTPDPVPTLTGHVWALVIYDPAVPLTPVQTAALQSTTLRASSLLQDVDVQSFKSTDPSVASWRTSYTKTGLPAVLFVQKASSGQGVLGYGTTLLGSVAWDLDILSLVNQVRGK